MARRPGPVERATRARLAKLRGVDTAIKAVAVALAKRMDVDPSAAVARELRLTVQALVAEAWEASPRPGQPVPPTSVDDDPDDDDADLARVVGMIGRGAVS